MTLTNRLTLFSLTALGIALAVFSGTTYVLARMYLMRQLNDRATATLDTLVAAAETEGDGLEWEWKNRQILLRGDGVPPVWAVFDETGRWIDGSNESTQPLDEFAQGIPEAEQSRVNVTWNGDHWRVFRRTLRHPRPESVRSSLESPRYQTLVFVTAWPVSQIHDLLQTLAWGLGGVSVGLWVISGLGGRWMCRRALAPVRLMTETANEITSDELGLRMPLPTAKDELHDLASRFNELLSRLQDSYERQRRFAGEASHQLRTPLTAMLGQMEVALRRDRDPEEYRRVLATSVSQAGRLRQIVESLLFLARADAEAQLTGLETVDLSSWMEEYFKDYQHDRKNDLHLEVPPIACRVNVLPALFAQVIDNLLDNAFKYSTPSTPVTIRLLTNLDLAALEVEDFGPGIASDDADRIFEPFFRSPEARHRGIAGLGLGLAVASRIVRAFGGQLAVKSEPGRGSRFTVTLPLPKQVVSETSSQLLSGSDRTHPVGT